jgi:hypothetical protein
MCNEKTGTVDNYITECNNVQFASTAERAQVVNRFTELRTMLAIEYELRTRARYLTISERSKNISDLQLLESSKWLTNGQKEWLKKKINEHSENLRNLSE